MVDYENERVKNYAKPFRDQNKRERKKGGRKLIVISNFGCKKDQEEEEDIFKRCLYLLYRAKVVVEGRYIILVADGGKGIDEKRIPIG